jgi:hypothetical protein
MLMSVTVGRRSCIVSIVHVPLLRLRSSRCSRLLVDPAAVHRQSLPIVHPKIDTKVFVLDSCPSHPPNLRTLIASSSSASSVRPQWVRGWVGVDIAFSNARCGLVDDLDRWIRRPIRIELRVVAWYICKYVFERVNRNDTYDRWWWSVDEERMVGIPRRS